MIEHACSSPRTHGSALSHYSIETQAESSAAPVYALYMRVWDVEALVEPLPVYHATCTSQQLDF